ncbi:uncharacterized protein LOC134456944 [Engraulis encrasicolus]|uniref:uncharacterized protein LOC134456944 n=1 Tax=Engraulis encrasicolus TaxID=184585 RepID=UPI002FCF3157
MQRLPKSKKFRRKSDDKENRPRHYKTFLCRSETRIPRSSINRKRNALAPLPSNQDSSAEIFLGPKTAKRPRSELNDESTWDVPDGSSTGLQPAPSLSTWQSQTQDVPDGSSTGLQPAPSLSTWQSQTQHVPDGSSTGLQPAPSLCTGQSQTQDTTEHYLRASQPVPRSCSNGLGQQDSEGDDLIYPGAPITKGQSLLLLMAYILRHNLTGVALEHLLQIFNVHFPGSVPATSYLFNKAYGRYGQYEPHFYCSGCTSYIGNATNQELIQECSICHMAFDADTNLKNGSYFIVLDLASQIKDILESPQTTVTKNVSANGVFTDIQSGLQYKKLIGTEDVGESHISLLWNTDGIPIFKSSKSQLWPIQCQIIELNAKDRKNNVCVPCLWFGEVKPNMTTLLTPFVDQLLKLEEEGISWTDTHNCHHSSKVHALVCSSDSVARAQIRNTKQFNGQYGCDFCYHRGSPYSNLTPEPVLRSESQHFVHAMSATSQQPVMGVKGPSPLMKLSKFQMINGFVPEYQHSVCLGVTRQLMKLWIDPKHHAKPWYIGTNSERIDEQLLAIKPPVELTRVPRAVKERKFWKASEWRSFLLFYALPVLSGILPKKYLNNLFLLVFGIYTLLQENIHTVDIDNAEKALKKFVMGFEKLYGRENMTFNVHLMTHISASVRNWGPLWATSTFSFESFNGTLLKYFNGTTYVQDQIVKRFLKWQDLSKHANKRMNSANDTVKNLFVDMQNSKRKTAKSLPLSDNVRVFGSSTTVNLPVRHMLAIEELVGVRVQHGLYYDRFIVDGVLYHSDTYKGLKKRNNSVVQLSDGTICKILSIVAFNIGSTQQSCVLVRELFRSGSVMYRDAELKISSRFVNEVTESHSIHAVCPQSFKRKCVMVNVKKMYVIALPNAIEGD